MTNGKAAAHCLFLWKLSRYQRQVVLSHRNSDSSLRWEQEQRQRLNKHSLTNTLWSIFDSVRSSKVRLGLPPRAVHPTISGHSMPASPNENMSVNVTQHKHDFHWIRYHSVLIWYINICIYIYIYTSAHCGSNTLVDQREAQCHFQFQQFVWYITRIYVESLTSSKQRNHISVVHGLQTVCFSVDP